MAGTLQPSYLSYIRKVHKYMSLFAFYSLNLFFVTFLINSEITAQTQCLLPSSKIIKETAIVALSSFMSKSLKSRQSQPVTVAFASKKDIYGYFQGQKT